MVYYGWPNERLYCVYRVDLTCYVLQDENGEPEVVRHDHTDFFDKRLRADAGFEKGFSK